MVDSKQFTIHFHVDDLTSSHIDPEVNTKFLRFLNDKYGKHVEVKCTRGTSHDYLGMTLDFENGKLTVDMVKYVKNMLEESPLKFKENERVATPAILDMFDSDDDKYLNTEQCELFHQTVARVLFLCK